ncbi:hypothetical protein G3I40_19705, partial [Streptomyces sp. SID14478]|nr:hypothetical protein [Streptomyces sp. SID14478]
ADLRLAATAGVPFFAGLALVVAGVMGAVVVVQVRVAARWSLTGRWSRPVRDPAGSVMLGGAVLVSAVCVWQLTLLAPLVTGVLALAAVAVDRRPTGPRGSAPLPPEELGATRSPGGPGVSAPASAPSPSPSDPSDPSDRTVSRHA